MTGTNANFLFRLDAQPLLDYGAGMHALTNQHLVIQTGITSVDRAMKARTDLSTSEVVETLAAQGAKVTPPGTSSPTPTLTRQRAFTVGADYSFNRLFGADGSGGFGEVGIIGKLHFNGFMEDQRFFEKDGLTYVKVASGLGSEGGYYDGQFGLRLRLSQMSGDKAEKPLARNKGKNVDDLLLFELVYQRNNAVAGLLADAHSENRLRWRFTAFPAIPSTNGTLKAVIGIEVNRDIAQKGPRDIRIFYGSNVNLQSLFARRAP